MNQLRLSLVALVIEEDTITAAYAAANTGATLPPARVKRLCQRINQLEAQLVMGILARRALLDPSRPEVYSLGTLAKIIGGSGRHYRAVENTLRERLLPDLAALGWIEGFVRKRDVGDTRRFEIRISKAGNDMYTQFLGRGYKEIKALLDELRDDDEPRA
jgi:hypothetical protein